MLFTKSTDYFNLGEKLSLKKGIKQCLGGLKCSQNTKKNKKTLKVSFKAISNVHFANLVSKELACSAGVFFGRAIWSRKPHVQTSRREGEMG